MEDTTTTQPNLQQVLKQMQDSLNQLTRQNYALNQQILNHNSVIQSLQSTHATLTPTPSKVKINKPKEFHGLRDEASSFLAQCHLVFSTDPTTYADDQLKINYIVSFLRGDAFKWYDAVIYRPGLTFSGLAEFEDLFKVTFGEDSSTFQDKAFGDLRRLTQTKSCQAYSTKFVQLAARVFVDEATKMYFFKEGLKPDVKLHLVGLRPAPKTLSELIRAAVEYDDALFRLRSATKTSFAKPIPKFAPTRTSLPADSPIIPMDVDAATIKPVSTKREKLSDAEKQRRRDNSLSLLWCFAMSRSPGCQ